MSSFQSLPQLEKFFPSIDPVFAVSEAGVAAAAMAQSVPPNSVVGDGAKQPPTPSCETNVEDIVCDVCGSGDVTAANDILLCDGYLNIMSKKPAHENCAFHLKAPDAQNQQREGAYHQLCHGESSEVK